MEEQFSTEVAKEIVGYLDTNNKDLSTEALKIILQFSSTQEYRLQYKDTELLKNLANILLDTNQFNSDSFKVALNFSQEEYWALQMIQKSYINKLISIIFESFKTLKHATNTQILELESVDKAGPLSQNLKQDPEYIFTYKVSEDQTPQNLKISFSLLILSNLCQFDEGKTEILQIKDEVPYVLFQYLLNLSIMFEWFANQELLRTFEYFANIIANITSSKTHRVYIKDSSIQFMERIHESLFTKVRDRRFGCEKALRNMLFEYEDINFIRTIIDPKYNLVDQLARNLLICLLTYSKENGKDISTNILQIADKLNITNDYETLRSYFLDQKLIYLIADTQLQKIQIIDNQDKYL